MIPIDIHEVSEESNINRCGTKLDAISVSAYRYWCTCYVFIIYSQYLHHIFLYFNRVSWVKVYGTMYTKKTVIAVSLIRGQLTFGEIVDVFVVDSNSVIFYYEQLCVLSYVHHFNAYKVQRSNVFAYVKQEDMADSHPAGLHTGFGDNSQDIFVVLKYHIDCMLE